VSGLYSESERIKIMESRIFALKDEIERMKREWIDPQRIVELAKRYTDEGKAGWLELVFRDANPDMWLCWSINTPNWEAEYEGESAAEVLKEAEA